ncbi:hypothetical protein [Microbacterium foliorum]|uniref:Uncharacterized protein n=1 Tax=Microbacterium foliorum TaxID=104336 RepID=A0A0F0KWU0_9MICO|nr:hypothetical protein [Microbacterium foliorum]KJL23701.1 hypothetical protein RN50_01041 [Microbacterium foliorum]
MKTTLPLIEQPAFKVVLPDTAQLAEGVQVDLMPGGIRLHKHALRLDLAVPEAATEAVVHRLRTGWPTAGLSATWKQLLEKLLASGMIRSAEAADPRKVPAADAIARIVDAIEGAAGRALTAEHPMNAFITGALSQSIARQWIIENFHFTAAADYHVPPVLEHDMSSEEREMWERFLRDESWHWRIYRPVLAQFDLSFEEVRAFPPMAGTTAFIEALHDAAVAGPVQYAAAMMFVERPPMVWEAQDDPLFGALLRDYGLHDESVRPLWWHTTENLHGGHSALGAVVITNRLALTPELVSDAAHHAERVVEAVAEWQREMLSPAGSAVEAAE